MEGRKLEDLDNSNEEKEGHLDGGIAMELLGSQSVNSLSGVG